LTPPIFVSPPPNKFKNVCSGYFMEEEEEQAKQAQE